MSVNAYSRRKDNAHIVLGGQSFILPADYTDYNFLTPIKQLFGIAPMGTGLGSNYSDTRTGGTVAVTKVFNFGRDPLTHVMANGMRCALPMLDINRLVVQGKPYQARPHSPEELVALLKFSGMYNIPLDNNIIIAQYYRLAAQTDDELRTIARSMHVSDNITTALERCPTFVTWTTEGQWKCLDILILTTVPDTTWSQHDNVLEAHSNVYISRKSIQKAPAHTNDRSGAAVESSNSKSTGILYERSTVSNCVLVYHDIGYSHRYTHDCGVVVEIPQVQDTSRKEGFYKEWHYFNEHGKLVIKHHFIERNKIGPAAGFFTRSMEALNYTPKKEIEEIYETIGESFRAFAEQLKQSVREVQREITTGLDSAQATNEKIVREMFSRDQAERKTLHEEMERMRREMAKAQRENEDLRQEVKESKNFKRELVEVIRVVGALIGLSTVIISQSKSKKKQT